MAAAYVDQNPEKIDGLLLWAAYPAGNNSLADRNLAVLSISGTQDGLANPEKIEASRALLPPSTAWLVIEGGNHAQFGSYGVQAGDGTAQIGAAEQQRLIVQATVDFLGGLAVMP
jgi:pimeloyl-ACP methyl ester carboxylesterase